MFHDFLLLSYAWVLTALWQWLAVPWLVTYFRNTSTTAAWALGRVSTWLLMSIVIWFLAHVGIPINTVAGIWLTLIGMAYFSQRRWKEHRVEIANWLKQRKTLILWQEALFLFGFFILTYIRMYQPQILDLEKFMDAGMMIAYHRSPTLPLEDMWLAGRDVNYYTFGHFMGSVASAFWGIEIRWSYNLLLGLVCGLVLMESFGLVVDLVGARLQQQALSFKQLIKAGLVGVATIGIGGNGHTLWYGLKNGGFLGYWYPDATRFIDRTIHEFPSYSFIVSDLHAHVWGMPIVLGMIWLLWQWVSVLLAGSSELVIKKWQDDESLPFASALGVGFGVLMMTSTWDFAVYGLLTATLGVLLLLRDRGIFWKLVLNALVVLLVAVFVASPWWLNFESISEGSALVPERSPFWQLLVLWLPHVTMSLVALGIVCWQVWQHRSKKLVKTVSAGWQQVVAAIQPQQFMIIAMVIAAIVLLALPEIIYVKDIYPNHPRANTMFKLTFQAFILMGIVISWLAGQIFTSALEETKLPALPQAKWLQISMRLLLGVFLAGVLVYPYFGYRDYYAGLRDRIGLDGLQWMASTTPDDLAAVEWLRAATTGRPVVLEAVGESYTTFARISTFTGLPTVLGWRVHEWLWRGGFDIPGQRSEEVRVIYEEPTTEQAKANLDLYKVKYIVIGDKERETYAALDAAGLHTLGTTVFATGQLEILEVSR